MAGPQWQPVGDHDNSTPAHDIAQTAAGAVHKSTAICAQEEEGGTAAAERSKYSGDVWDVPDEPEGAWFSWRTLMAYMGPGFLMCIAYLDPGNLEADLQMGAYTGFQLLWVLLLAHVFGLLLQSMAARLAIVTDMHLATAARLNYRRTASLALWLMAELAIIGSDIQEVLGSAIALRILTGIPLWAGCLITALDTFTFLMMHVFGVRKLEALFVFLVGVMTVTFFINFGMDPPDAGNALEGFVPTINSHTAVTALALLGAVIMPHNLFLHSALVLSRRINRTSKRKVWEGIKYCTIDSAIALAVAFVINLAVVSTFATQFYSSECAELSPPTACLSLDSVNPDAMVYGSCTGADGAGMCQEIGLDHAADALKGTLGSSAKYIWAVGLLAAGQSSTMTGTYSGQFVMEGFLQLNIPQWQRALLTRTVALGPALLVTILLGDTDKLTQWLNVLQSVQLPFALIPLVHFCGSKQLMGDFVVGRGLLALMWGLTVVVIGINIYTVLNFFVNENKSGTPVLVLLSVIGVLYMVFCLYLMQEDLARLRKLVRRSSWCCNGSAPTSGTDPRNGADESPAIAIGDRRNGAMTRSSSAGLDDSENTTVSLKVSLLSPPLSDTAPPPA